MSRFGYGNHLEAAHIGFLAFAFRLNALNDVLDFRLSQTFTKRFRDFFRHSFGVVMSLLIGLRPKIDDWITRWFNKVFANLW